MCCGSFVPDVAGICLISDLSRENALCLRFTMHVKRGAIHGDPLIVCGIKIKMTILSKVPDCLRTGKDDVGWHLYVRYSTLL